MQNSHRENIVNQLLRRPALGAFILIFLMLALNAIFNSLASAFGFNFPYTTFLFNSNDLFADYFKVIFSYPDAGNLRIEGTSRVSKLLATYLDYNSYQGYVGLPTGSLTHFHLTPLTTFFSLINLKLMKYVNPIYLFIGMLLINIYGIYIIIREIAFCKTDKILWCLTFLICYPTLFLVTRGNLFAGITALSLIGYLILMYKGKQRYLAIALLALAVNIRPNSIIFVCALLLGKSESKVKDLLVFLAVAASFFLTALSLSNFLYADYTISNFLAGLRTYHALYVVQDNGMTYGSSLYGLLKAVFGFNAYFESASALIGAAIVATATAYYVSNKISKLSFVFNLCSAYALSSSVFADYHLLIFLAPLMCLYLQSGSSCHPLETPLRKQEMILIFFSSILLLSPKNYVFHGIASAQIIINPIILLMTSAILIAKIRVG